jgi:hypothetical protein
MSMRTGSEHTSRESLTAFSFAVSLANRRNVGYLLEVAAGISAIAGLSNPIEDRLARACHYQVSRVIVDAILRSNSSTESQVYLDPGDIGKLVNNAIDVTNDLEALRKLQEVNGTDAAKLEMMRYLGQLGQVQIAPFEEAPTHVAGRAIGLLEVLPARHREFIDQRVVGATQVLGVSIEELLGISVRDAAELYLVLLGLCANRWKWFNSCLPKGDNRLEEALIYLDQGGRDKSWSFTPDLVGRLSRQSEEKVRAFLLLFSRTPAQLRGLLGDAAYPFQIGHPACRMLPIDRYPIVALPDDNYVIPSITTFRKSFPHVMDYSLLDIYNRRGLAGVYNQVRGAAMELYISELITARLPHCTLIPETAYQTPLGVSRSPDLCIFDPSDASLVVVEAKARRLSPEAAAITTNRDLDENHRPSIQALVKLPKKIEDLYREPEFGRWLPELKLVAKDRTVLVSVVSGAVFFHDEIEQLRAYRDPHHPLRGLDQAFCFLDLPIFERAVEIACEYRLSLAQLFREHFEDARAAEVKAGARLFRDRWMKLERREEFSWRFFCK